MYLCIMQDKKMSKYLPFEVARDIIRKEKLKTREQFVNFIKSNKLNIPITPERVYSDYWISLNDWLGIDWDGFYLSFEEARAFIRKLGLKNQNEWSEYRKNKPANIPSNPNRHYKNEWLSTGDWIGTDVIATRYKKYLSFNDARNFVHTLGLKNQKEWYKWHEINRPNDIPYSPYNTYKNEFISFGDWIGTTKGWDGTYLSFEEAIEFVHALKLKNLAQWLVYCNSGKKPFNIPASPESQYKGKYISAGDWLGTGRIADQLKREQLYVSYEEAKAFVLNLGLKSHQEWVDYCNSGLKPDNIPSNPNQFYGKKR